MPKFQCSGCQRSLQVKDDLIGKKVKCPCGKLQLVPESVNATGSNDQPHQSIANDWLNELPLQPPPISGSSFNSSANPYAAPERENSPSGDYLQKAETDAHQSRSSERGATSKSLNSARWILIIVGILTILLNTFLLINSQKEVQEVIQQQGEVDISAAGLLLFVRVIYGGFILFGCIFIALGLVVYQFPLMAPLTGLILYVLGAIVSGLFDPTSLLKGIILKIIIVVALIKAINEGAYYKK
jgi:uncharacterized integral membrane protein